MRSLTCPAVLGLALALLSPAHGETLIGKAEQGKTQSIAHDDPAMNAAFAKAQQTLGQFLDAFEAKAPGTGSFLVKIPISDGDKREYFWVNELTRTGNQFSGRIKNRPEVVQNIQYGQLVTFPRSRIRDWMYVDHGKTLGNFTTCVLLSREDPAQAQELMNQMKLTCEHHGS
ncbi:YegJ family protein [Labrys okinawensis]|uniref:YegJ family protein n=1 Tax=Labrys okinawensis TaxID=346911 RepID=UPI0039BD5E0F